MSFRKFAGAALITALTATSAVAQSGDIKGWTPRAPGSGGAGAGVAAPGGPGGGGAGAGGPISRGAGDPAPRPPGGGIAVGPGGNPGAGNPGGPGAGGRPAGGGQAQVFVHANDPASIQRAIQSAGYRAELTTDDQGNPKIIGTAGRSTYWLLFLDCQLDIGCAGLEFFVGYSAEYAPSLEAINEFNNNWRYIRASVANNGNPLMYMDIIVRDGGISERAFTEYLRLWHDHFVPGFEQLVGF